MNLKKLEKSNGVLLFAFPTDTVDYLKIASNSSRLIKKFLNLPITLVTDSTARVNSGDFDKIIEADQVGDNYRFLHDYSVAQWKNFNRFWAYEMSPYDNTLLLDVDYLVLSSRLGDLMSLDYDYRLPYNSFSDHGRMYNSMGETSLPHAWATVFMFRKTVKTKLFFDLVERIQNNYNYYRFLYNIRDANYRNDYAFSIANIILNGYTLDTVCCSISGDMISLEKSIDKIYREGSFINVRYTNGTSVIQPVQDLHILDKQYLLSDEFEKLVGSICEPT